MIEGTNVALIDCYECGKQISNTASACPNCGAAVERNQKLFVFSLSVKDLKRIKKALMIVFITIACVAIVIVSYRAYISLDSERFESIVRASVQEKLNTSLSSIGIEVIVPSIEITHIDGNKYKGDVAIQIDGSTYRSNIIITDTGSGVEWEQAALGEFLFLAPYLMKNALSPILNSETKKPTSDNIVSKLQPISKIDGWSVHVASLSKNESAIALVEKLKAENYTAYIKNADGMNRVFVGPVVDRTEANRLRDQLERLQKLNGFVVRYSPSTEF